MGNPKFPRKKYTTPLHPWKEDRIKSERELLKKYGLKNHKEVWKAKTYLGRHRHQARELLAKMGTKDPQVKKESDQLLLHLTRIGVLPAASSLDDVLALETESVLSRRLQTLVYLKGLSTTPDHSRQLINHGHIAINKRKLTIPGYMVTKDEENEIGYTGRSPLNEMSHPARPKTDVYKTEITPTEEKKTKEPVKPKEKPDIKEEKDKDTKEDATERAKKSEEKTENKDVKEEKTEEPKEPVKQPEDDKKERPAEDKKTELPSEIKKESAEEKTEPVEKPETKNKKSNEKEGGN
jgi:small subunit ribosomal protein S4